MPLSEDDEALLAHCRRIAWAVTADAYGEDVADQIDIEVLQRLVDDEVCAPDDAWALQSLGVRLGDILCDAGFHWVAHTIGERRDLAVAWKQSGWLISAPVLIQKRVEDGEDCNVRALYDWALRLPDSETAR